MIGFSGGAVAFPHEPLWIRTVVSQHLHVLRGGGHVSRGQVRSLCGGACRLSRWPERSHGGGRKGMTLGAWAACVSLHIFTHCLYFDSPYGLVKIKYGSTH